MTGQPLARILSWDTDFFGFTVGRVEADALTADMVSRLDVWAEAQGVHCIYFLARADDAPTTYLAETADFHLVDVRVTLGYCFEDESANRESNSAAIRPVQPAEISHLRAIAQSSHHDSRFYFDRNFPRERVDALYETWITRSCNGYADTVLVAHVDGEPTGYITCHLHPSRPEGEIGLVAVAGHARGRGLGTALVRAALAWFGERNVHHVTVVTQGRNIGAQQLYQKCGFVVEKLQLWYHKWYPESK